jgi:hypothetical protein
MFIIANIYNRQNSADHRQGNESRADFQLHYQNVRLHFEIQQQERHQKHIHHIPFVQMLQKAVCFVPKKPYEQSRKFRNRRQECEKQNHNCQQIFPIVEKQLYGFEKGKFFVSKLPNNLRMSGKQRKIHSQSEKYD